MLAIAILAALQVADIYTTHRVLANGGRELNPLLAKLFARFGILQMLIPLKLSFLALAYLYIPEGWVWGLSALYALIVANNVRQMR
jgi:hypothetical protein